MTSNSAADFRRIIASSRSWNLPVPPDPLHGTAARMSGLAASRRPRRCLLECLLDLGKHLVHGVVGVDTDEVALRPVVADQRLRLAVVQLESLRDRFGRVVLAVLDLGPPQHALDAHAVVELEAEDDREGPPDVREHPVERLRLRRCATETVENEAVFRVVLPEPLPDQLDHQVVWDELAALHDRLYAAAKLRLPCDRVAKDLPGRDVRNPVLGLDPLRLGSLPRPLRTEEEHVHFRKPS